jgi:dTDP-glucose 4,6-dehydratase
MAPDRLGQDSRYWLDSSAIKKDVGWEPQIGWQEGLAEMVAWGRKYLPELRKVNTSYVMRG